MRTIISGHMASAFCPRFCLNFEIRNLLGSLFLTLILFSLSGFVYIMIFSYQSPMAIQSTDDLSSPLGPSVSDVGSYVTSSSSASTAGQRRPSFVWDYFIYDEDQQVSICQCVVEPEPEQDGAGELYSERICNKIIKGLYLMVVKTVKYYSILIGKFTTNLKRHLQNYHHKEFDVMNMKELHLKTEREKSELIQSGHSSSSLKRLKRKSTPAYSKDSNKYKELTRKLAIFIGCTNVSLRMVTNEHLRELLYAFDPAYIVPGISGISKEIESIFLEMKAQIKSRLALSNKISFCVDIWTEKGLTESYLGITAHFFSHKDLLLHHPTLAVKRIDKHTGVDIREIFDKVLNDWEIEPRKIMAVVTDNGSNILKAFKEFVLEIDDEEITNLNEEEEENEPHLDVCSSVVGDEINLDFIDDEIEEFERKEEEQTRMYSALNRISCFFHTLQLVVHNLTKIQTIKRTLSDVYKVVQKVNSSTVATSKLIGRCGLKLVGSCPTRWFSTYLVVKRLVRVKDHLIAVLHELKIDGIQASQWLVLEGLLELLTPFAHITELASGENYPTIGEVMPYCKYLDSHLSLIIESKDEESSIPCIFTAATMLREELNRRFNFMNDPTDRKFNIIYLVGSFLTPASKRFVGSDNVTEVQKEIIDNCTDVNVGEITSGESDGRNDSAIEQPPAKKSCIESYDNFMFRYNQASEVGRSITRKKLISALNTYMTEDVDLFGKDAVKFWVSKLNQSVYSKIASYALDVLAVPALSAPVEWTCSTAGESTTGKHNRLQEKNLERGILLRRNLTYYELD